MLRRKLARRIEKVLQLEESILKELDKIDFQRIKPLAERMKMKKDIDYLKALSVEEKQAFKEALEKTELLNLADMKQLLIETDKLVSILKDRLRVVKDVVRSSKR